MSGLESAFQVKERQKERMCGDGEEPCILLLGWEELERPEERAVLRVCRVAGWTRGQDHTGRGGGESR